MRRAFVLLGLVFFLGGCATLPRQEGGGAPVSLEALCRKHAADCSWDGVAQTVTMHHRGRKVQALVGSAVVLLGDSRVMLSAPLRRQHGAVVVPPDFENIVFPAQIPPAEGRPFVVWSGKVVVDAGHGGKDPGAIGFGGVKEKDIVRDIADRLVRALRNAGIDAVSTRDSDVFITLAQRTEQASRLKADLFVSIHANASKSRRASGFEIYSAAPLNADDRGDPQRHQNVRKFCAGINMRQEVPALRNIVGDMLYGYKLIDTPVLAQAVSSELSREFGRDFRGSKAARFFVLRNTLVPAVLVEVGFISNPREAMMLKGGVYRQRIAEAIAKGVMRCMNAAGN